MSYAHHDDGRGALSRFHRELTEELHSQSGRPIEIFKDNEDIELGQQWRERLAAGLAESTFLLPIITPSFLRSRHCREEYVAFTEHERARQRRDLVLPVYYIDSNFLISSGGEAAAATLTSILERQYFDWRNLRSRPFSSHRVRQELERLATMILQAMARGN
jgi:hypothetical protein